MKVTKYCHPRIDSVGISPQTSLCTNWSFRVKRISPTGLNWARCIFPSTRPSQNDSFDALENLIPVANFFWTMSGSCCPFTCPSLWCHRSISFVSFDVVETEACSREMAGSQSKWYIFSVNKPIPHSFPFLSLIQHLNWLNFTMFPLQLLLSQKTNYRSAWECTVLHEWQTLLVYSFWIACSP